MEPRIGWDVNLASAVADNRALSENGYFTDDAVKKTLASTLGSNLTQAERNLMFAFEGKDLKGNPLVVKDDQGNVLEGDAREKKLDTMKESAVQVAKISFDRAQRLYQAFANIMDSAHQIMMKQVDRIRA